MEGWQRPDTTLARVMSQAQVFSNSLYRGNGLRPWRRGRARCAPPGGLVAQWPGGVAAPTGQPSAPGGGPETPEKSSHPARLSP
jgi:hypothetical protein